MIYYLSGNLVEKTNDFIVVDVGGVGYQVFIPASFSANLPDITQPVLVYTYQYIREDQNTLFGFENSVEREVFLTLTGVSGIGPKLGLKILSTCSSAQLQKAILQEDLVFMTSIPGVGKKMAEKMIIELRDKLQAFASLGHALTDNASGRLIQKPHDDLFMAMKTLGYNQDEIKRALIKSKDALTDNSSLEDNIKIILKNL
jgi:Holliday junction DNA helicase RuvA